MIATRSLKLHMKPVTRTGTAMGGGEAVAETLVVPPAVSQPMDIPPFNPNLDLDAMHALVFPEYANIGVADAKDREFRIRMEYSSRK
ncbi:uncharacterized protein DS421_15g497280 [Arachis hypogaea]|nr:uncharacterized protein DS421_15g497280 [Arachis hypogaea]